MIKNVFREIPEKLPEELFETILASPGMRIERILSRGHASPENYWYDQDENEWVMLLSGSAILRFAEGDVQVAMKAGDYLNIPAGVKHRVEETDPVNTSIWLAVFY